MLEIRPFEAGDAAAVLSWCRDEKAFYQWTAGILGSFPITEEEFGLVTNLMPFVACDETGTVGFFTLRRPEGRPEELRFGFVILDPRVRGKGCGKAMLRLGIRAAFDVYGAKRVSLGVFENNFPAYHCYKAAGFRDVTSDTAETYRILGEEWKCKELMLEKE